MRGANKPARRRRTAPETTKSAARAAPSPRLASTGTFAGRAERWGSGGDALVRLADGSEAWGRGLVPGDTGVFRVSRDGTRAFASLVKLEAPSPDRITPACEHAVRCGGCPWMAASPTLVAETKRGLVARATRDAVPVEWVGSPVAIGYRRRARLAFEVRPHGELRLGYHAARSSEIVDVASCIILEPVLAGALERLRDALAHAKGRGELRLSKGARGLAIAALTTETDQPTALYDALRSLVEKGELAGASLATGIGPVRGAGRGTRRDDEKPATFGDAVERTPTADGEPLLGTHDGFSQANDAVALAMAATVAEWAEPDGRSVLELYAGHGHLTLGLARRASKLTAVEQSAEATRALRTNLAVRGLAASVVTADASAAPEDPVDIVVLDPPRTGAAEALPRALAARPSRIVMASCDPRTLERDLRVLVGAGYTVTAARAFDMFPGTPHVEAVVRLDRLP